MPVELPPSISGQLVTASLFAAVGLLITGIVYKILSRYISKIGRKIELDAHAENSLHLALRVLAIAVAAAIVSVAFGVPTSLLLGGSALVGAAIGLGSSQTIGNIVAGFYVIITRPFSVKDYVRIGDIEGQVEEISVNYTRVYAPTRNLLNVPNISVMNNQILNLTHEGLIIYSFPIGFTHELTSNGIIHECIEPAIEEFYSANKTELLRKPEYYFESSDRLGRSFRLRIFVRKGQANILFRLQPQLLERIVNRWDMLRIDRLPS